MTEDEARSKWCPFSRVDNIHITPNRLPYDDNLMQGSNCIASSCMMWGLSNNSDPTSGCCGNHD